MVTYAPRVTAHSTRMGAERSLGLIRLLVIHTSEGGELPTSAEALASYISRPRVQNPDGSWNLASYHDIFDHDRIIPCAPPDRVAFAAAGANHDGLHACYPGKAGQSADQWADWSSTLQNEQASQWLADKSEHYNIPLRKLSPAEVLAGHRGVCGHHDVSLAFRKSTHTDPGPAYPWKHVLGRAIDLANPGPLPTPNPNPEEDDMQFDGMWCQPGTNNDFAVYSDNTKIAMTSPGHFQAVMGLETLRNRFSSDAARGPKRFFQSHDQCKSMGFVIGGLNHAGCDPYGWKA